MTGFFENRVSRTCASALMRGSLLGLALLGGTQFPDATLAAPAALYCAPVSATFGIFADEIESEQLDIPALTGCHVSANSTAPQGSNNSVEMAEPAAQQSASSDENVWMQAYAAMAHDRVE